MVSLFGRGFDSLQLHFVPQEGIILIIWKCILHLGQLHFVIQEGKTCFKTHANR